MIVKPAHKKLILNLRDPTKVTNLLPTARVLHYQGRALTVVPHRIDEVRLLRNIGLDAPHPIDHYYDWPIRQGWTPFPHQKETARFLSLHNRAYCLNDMGTSKTLSALWAWDFMRRENPDVAPLLVVAPLATLEATWANEVFFNFPRMRVVVLHGHKDQRRKLLAQSADIYVINHDGVKVILEDLTRKTFGACIIDELSQAARNASTDRWKHFKALIKDIPTVWGMTGTPIPNAPTDAWAQCRLLTPSTVPSYFGHFRDKVMRQVTEFKWVPREGALETVYEAMQPAIRYKREDVLADLPPVMYETRHARLTAEQKRMFDEMMGKLYTQSKGESITAVNEGVKAMKLVQICTGSTRGDEEVIDTPPKHRLLALRDVIEEAGSKVIVFVPFRASLELVADVLSKGYSVEKIHGGVSKTERDRIFQGFQHGKDPHVLVAQPAAMSHGLTLTAASCIVWFAPITSAETYEQANARITRPGQKLAQLIVHLQGTDLEARMYDRLKHKTTMQGVLLDMFKKAS